MSVLVESTRTRTVSRVFVARLVGTTVFDPSGTRWVGPRRRNLIQMRGEPRVKPGHRGARPPPRVPAAVAGHRHRAGAVITTGLVNIRRFEQRHVEYRSSWASLLDRVVTMRDGTGPVTVRDVAIERDKHGLKVTRLFVQRGASGPLGLRRGETSWCARGGHGPGEQRRPAGATALLATMEDLKPADLADVLSDLPRPARSRWQPVRSSDERLADAVEELSTDDAVALLSGLEAARAADVLDAMQPDDAADLVSELPAQGGRALGPMQPEEAEDVRRLMRYDTPPAA